MKVLRNEQGQMLILTAIELVLLIGFLALAADVGVLFHSKRKMQTAADAAATAGALNELNGGYNATNVTDQQAADTAASANGFTNGKDGVVVTVNAPPTSGYHKTAGYVEATISKPDPLYFFKAFLGKNTTTVAARAVAGSPAPSPLCMWFKRKIYLQGSATITGYNNKPACGIYVDSTSSDAIDNNDTGTVVNANFLETPGGTAKKPTSPTPVTQIKGSVNPPFQNIPFPTDGTGGPCTGSNTYGKASYVTGDTLPFASYTFTSATGQTTSIPVVCFSQNVSIGSNKSSVTNMQSGFYFFENGATMNGQVNFAIQSTGGCNQSASSSIGATIYNFMGTFQQNNGDLAICSPTAGVYNAMAIVQPTSNTNQLDLQFGMSNSTLTACNPNDAALNGYIYAPGATVYMHDSGGGALVTGIVANELYDKASTLTVCNYNTVNRTTTPNRAVALVE